MNSLWGIIAHIIEKTGWTWDYILHGVSWINIQMMLADAPRYRPTNKETPSPVVTAQATDDDIDNFVNG